MTIENYKAPASERVIALNVSSSECVILEDITLGEMHDVISQFERIRIENFWKSKFIRENEEGNNIVAFETKTFTSHTGPVHLKTSALQKSLKTNARGQALVSLIQSLSVEEQKKIALSIMPTTRSELIKTALYPNTILSRDYHELLEKSKSAELFIDTLASEMTGESLYKTYDRQFELLTMFWAKNWLLFPQSFTDWRGRYIIKTLTNPIYGGEKSSLILSTYAVPQRKGTDKGFHHTCTFFATADVRTHQDFSEGLIKRFEEICIAKIAIQYPPETRNSAFLTFRGKARSVALWLLQTMNNMNPEHSVELKRPKRNDVADEERRVDGKFRWLATKRPELCTWAELFAFFILSRDNARIGSIVDRLNTFGDFLCTLNSPPLKPWLVDRRDHISDVRRINNKTYRQYLIDNITSKRRRNDNIGTMRKFFDWLRDYLIANDMVAVSKFPDPLNGSDRFGSEATASKTYRDSLPPYIINEIKSVLIEDDFAFPKTLRSMVQVRDQRSGLSVKVFDPGLTICLYTLVDTPIRSHQARWLDSGQLDEFVYNGQNLVLNSCEFAVPGRKEGALKLEHDSLRADTWLALWVNTNKTASYDSKIIGYAIPYVSQSLAGLLQYQNEWQNNYLPPLREPLSYSHYQQDTRERERPTGVHRPTICPLFRDPNSADQNRPLEYSRLARFYTAVLEQTQKNIKRKYGQSLKLVTFPSKGSPKWAVDLHSLRVSGVTNLIEAGVPLEVVQQFVTGHHTLVMLLHYLKYSPAKLRQFMEDAYERMKNDIDFIGSEVFLESLDEFAPFLLGQEGAGGSAGLTALRERDGIMTITSDGICPGTSCSNGGALESISQDKYGPVPGGKRCGLCRFWLTGPAHLLGQVTAVNNLAFAIRRKGLEIAALNDACLDAEDEGNIRKAREVRDRIDLLSRELDIDINEWAARYRYAEHSIMLMDEYLATKNRIIKTDTMVPVPILTSSSAHELKLTLEQAHEFALLDQITQMSRFTTGFTNREAELEKNTILSKMMVANGMKPFLLTLTSEQAHEAANMLSALILQQVSTQELDEVLNGTLPLDRYPNLESAFRLLENCANKEALNKPGEMSRLASLIMPQDFQDRGKDDDDEEELFG
ncbi:VPA1269 family protein [Pseudomonas sp. TNT2022 ID1044]|uniref:VPA1269 family protein n=1 Tax=Pseudomonas sp. TNT2022 ID1044 TaxID=2942636 RepID=UPI002361C567|nr:VPA1269 family protein [Pseudomonas sp. TNT2022 ID1044]MDD0999129.1 VPA1269 family protein [Pseudomonas sp. TNT2022 ID1044]